uniref:Uncharacterized protein n=1 Tax=Oryza glaberrima TaxID=4538 RepID=I1P606_ORYGL
DSPTAAAGYRRRGYSLMGCIKDIPTLKGDNYEEWKRELDLAFILGEVD